MKGRNILESFFYAIGCFIKYTILFAILFSLLFGVEGVKNAIYSWCIPLSLGNFLGYLGGKQFIWLVKLQNLLLLIVVLIMLNVMSAFIVRNIILNEEQWWSTIVTLTIPICFGYIQSVPVGLKQNVEERK